MSETSGNPERRVDKLTREIFDRAVGQAATIATQNVARIHRTRLVMQSFLAAFLISVAVGVILAIVFRAEVQNAGRANSLYNCQLIQDVTSPLADFVQTDAHLRNQQGRVDPHIQKVFQQLLGKKSLTAAEIQQAKLNSETTHYWDTSVVPRLRAIGRQNCSSHLH